MFYKNWTSFLKIYSQKMSIGVKYLIFYLKKTIICKDFFAKEEKLCSDIWGRNERTKIFRKAKKRN